MNNRKLITMESVLKSDVFKECHYELPIILGKTAITNEIIIKDLTRLHHILVGGSTGQGKTTSLHAMITSFNQQEATVRDAIGFNRPEAL